MLSPAEARELLARILGPDRVAAEAAATAELARMCGLLPLALRIAAANLLDQPGRGTADYLAELTETSRLAGLAVDGDPEAAVRAAFDTSYAVLDPDDRRMFRLLGTVPMPQVTAPAAAALAAVPLRRAARLLDRLAGAHLLEPRATGRFGFHDLLRLYARQRAQEEDETEARQAALGRLLDWYLQVADAAARLLYPEKTRLPLPPIDLQPPQVGFADRAHALAWLDAERPNLVAAVQHAAAHGPRPAAWLIADTLRGYFVLARFPTEWAAVARAGLAAAEADDQPRAQAAAHLSLADLGVVQSRNEQATKDYLRALPLARRAGWLHGEAAALGNLGIMYQQSGRLQEASEHHARALALDGQTGSLAGQAVNLGNLGLVSWLMGRLEQAADYDLRALALYRETGSSYGEALTLRPSAWPATRSDDSTTPSSTSPRRWPCSGRSVTGATRAIPCRDSPRSTATPDAAVLPWSSPRPPWPSPRTPGTAWWRPTPCTSWPPSTCTSATTSSPPPAARRPCISRWRLVSATARPARGSVWPMSTGTSAGPTRRSPTPARPAPAPARPATGCWKARH